MTAWIIRAGKQGENEQYFLREGLAGGGWLELPDLTPVEDRDAMRKVVEQVFPTSSTARVGNYTGQLWSLRNRIAVGDLVVLPLKTTSQIAIGRVIGTYEYRTGEPLDKRHVRKVEWQVTDIPRTAVKQDLLFSMGSALTICSLERNDAEWRVNQLLATGTDPGARPDITNAVVPITPEERTEEADEAIVTSGLLDVERYAKDRLNQVVAERFAGYAMQRLVAAILEVDGFHTDVPAEGPDGGIDVVAGSGPLGLDSPRVIVQVKSSPTPIGAPEVQQLQGAIAKHGADYGLLVAWGGLRGPARREIESNRFRIRVWDADDLIEAVIRTYDQLPDDIQAKLPLRSVWVVVEDDASGDV